MSLALPRDLGIAPVFWQDAAAPVEVPVPAAPVEAPMPASVISTEHPSDRPTMAPAGYPEPEQAPVRRLFMCGA